MIDRRGVTPRTLGGQHAPGGVPVLAARNVRGGRMLLGDDVRYVSPELSARWMPEPLRSGDVLVTSEGPAGEVTILDADIRYCLGPRLFALRADSLLLDSRFLFYMLQSRGVQAQFRAKENGSRMQGIRQADLLEVELELPPLAEQRRIAAVLAMLDAKIALNRELNRTLEALAQAVFKSWFVDFDPVVARAAGRAPDGMSAHTASQFPYCLAPSALGPIPETWTVSTIGEEVRVVGGSTPSTARPEFWDGPIRWATPRDLSGGGDSVLVETGRRLTGAGLKRISSGLLPQGTVLLSSRAPIGYLAVAAMPLAVNQGFIAMVCDGQLSNYYVLEWVRASMTRILTLTHGSSFPEIGKRNFRSLPVPVPPQAVLDAWDALAAPLYARIARSIEESLVLTELRGRLLEEFLGGQILLSEPVPKQRPPYSALRIRPTTIARPNA